MWVRAGERFILQRTRLRALGAFSPATGAQLPLLPLQEVKSSEIQKSRLAAKSVMAAGCGCCTQPQIRDLKPSLAQCQRSAVLHQGRISPGCSLGTKAMSTGFWSQNGGTP